MRTKIGCLIKSFCAALLAVFILSSNAFGFMAYRDDGEKYCLQELQGFIKDGNTSAYGTHMWLNAKCIKLFEERTGIQLSESARLYITLGAITADYDMNGSSSTKSNYSEIDWSIELGNNINRVYIGNSSIQSNKCANHFYNGPQANHGNERLTDFPAEDVVLNNVSAYQWAFNSPDNNFDFQDALVNRNSVNGWRAIGETLHLLADMGSPAHTRNDNHMPGWGEDYYEEKLGELSFGEYDSLAKFPDKYPSSMLSPGADLKIAFDELQSYTSSHFFSKDTLFESRRGGIDLARVGIGDYLTNSIFLARVKVRNVKLIK